VGGTSCESSTPYVGVISNRASTILHRCTQSSSSNADSSEAAGHTTGRCENPILAVQRENHSRAQDAKRSAAVTPLNVQAGAVHTSDSAGSLHTCITDAEAPISPTNTNVLVAGLQTMFSFSPRSGSPVACLAYPGMQGLSSSELRSMSAFQSTTSATSPVPPYPADAPTTTPIRQMVKSGASPRSVSTWSRDPQHTVSFDEYAVDVADGAAPRSPVSCFKLDYAHNVVTPAPSKCLRLSLDPYRCRILNSLFVSIAVSNAVPARGELHDDESMSCRGHDHSMHGHGQVHHCDHLPGFFYH
jgi:hypothetical protein